MSNTFIVFGQAVSTPGMFLAENSTFLLPVPSVTINAVFSTFFEAGRVILLHDDKCGLTVPGAAFVLAHTSIHFLGEILWPGEVEVGSAIAGIGNSSLRFRQALFTRGACVATAENTLVRVDKDAHKPLPFAPEQAARIRASMPAAPRV